MEKQMSSFNPHEYISVESSIHSIECAKSWGQLLPQEQLYAFWMARAAWSGSRICWFQRSYESPALLVLLYSIFNQEPEKLRERLDSVSDIEWN